MPNIICDSCGGNDFYIDSGFYYCTECQRQTQDIQEHVFEDYVYTKRSKKIKKSDTKKEQGERITSWECYNYILLGLVNELTELGASENLKSTVRVLWFKYLKSFHVVGKAEVPPKLPACNSRVDAEIIYGRKTIKKKKSRSRDVSPSSSTDVSKLDYLALRKERAQKKKALAKAKYEDFLSTTQQSGMSLANQSLSTLKGNSQEIQKNRSKFLQYHPTASKELKRNMSKKHFKDHCTDVNSTLTCHKPSVRKVSRAYITSPYVLSRSKLYSILYLGLLINKESIQLGDILRYIREGYLSYEHCEHFFPEEFVENQLNACTFTRGNQVLLSTGIRSCSAKMAKFLNVNKYIAVQNLVELCKRYCEELNLPGEICQHVLNLLSKSQPKMVVYGNTNFIPNYEARAMSFVIFILKLFFCLDDATEFEMSKLADVINKNFPNDERRMFNFETWLKYIEYRKLILAEYHFPTKYLDDNYNNPDSFIGFLTSYKERIEENYELPLDMQLIKSVLEKIKSSSDYTPVKFDYSPSLTPCQDNTKQLLNLNLPYPKDFVDLLSTNCIPMSLDHLRYMKSYKEYLLPNEKLIYKHGGKNDEIKMSNLYDKQIERYRKFRIENKTVKVTFLHNDKKRNISNYDKRPPKRFKDNCEKILENFENRNSKIFKQNEIKDMETQENFDRSMITGKILGVTEQIDNFLYNPTERFWLNLQNISEFSNEETKTFLKSLPFSFRSVLKECAKIIEQTEKDLYVEYCIVEAYLCYVLNIKTGKFYNEKFADKELRKLLEKARKMW